MNNPVITLTTDFGMRDGFAGVMKGVILRINPRAVIVDISHDVPAWDVRAGAFVLSSAYRYFPAGSIHVCVIDPGVGSGREILIARTPEYYFLAPDNGLLSPVLDVEQECSVYRISNPEMLLPEISNTFHGRDIFAPAAAHLSINTPVERIGVPFAGARRELFPEPCVEVGRISGEIIYRDSFGNLITNIRVHHLTGAGIDKDRAVMVR